MPRKQKEIPSVEQITEQLEQVVVEKPKRTRKTKIVEAAVVETAPAPVQVEKKVRAPSKWVSALKKYNEGKAGYIIPKKGTAEYDAVRALMG